MPRISPARASASSGELASLMPPAFPRPPMSTCALTTTGAAELLGRGPGLGRARREQALRDGDPVPPEELLALILVQVQSAGESTASTRHAPSRTCEHHRVSKTTLIVLIALGATFAGFVLASNAQRLSGDDEERSPRASPPARRPPTWTGGSPTDRSASSSSSRSIGSTSRSRAGARASASRTTRRSAGSSLRARRPRARSGCSCSRPASAEELEERNRNGTLPAVRAATGYVPELPGSARARSVLGGRDLRARRTGRGQLGARRVRHARRRREAARRSSTRR